MVSSSGGAHAADIGGTSNHARKAAAPTTAAAPSETSDVAPAPIADAVPTPTPPSVDVTPTVEPSTGMDIASGNDGALVRRGHAVSPTHSDLTPGARPAVAPTGSPAPATVIGTAKQPAASDTKDVVGANDPAAPLSLSAAPEPVEQVPASGLAAVPAALAALLSPFASSDPNAPVDSPLTWMVAAAARRQFGVQPSVEPSATEMTACRW